MIALCIFLFLLLEPTIALPDWLVTEVKIPAELEKFSDGRVLKLTNGIVTRTFLTDPNFVTIDLYSHEKNSSVLRALDPEVTSHCTHYTCTRYCYDSPRFIPQAKITLDGVEYDVGGIQTAMSRAYLNRTALHNDVNPRPGSFMYSHYTLGPTQAPYPYVPRRGVPDTLVWPPRGVQLRVTFRAPPTAMPSHRGVSVDVVYELYEGMPLFTKWVTVSSNSLNGDVAVTFEAVEILAVNEDWADWIYFNSDLPKTIGVSLKRETEPDREAGSAQTIFTYKPTDKVVFRLNPANRKSFKVASSRYHK